MHRNFHTFLTDEYSDISPSEVIFQKFSQTIEKVFGYVIYDRGFSGMRLFFENIKVFEEYLIKFLEEAEKDIGLQWFRQNFLQNYPDCNAMEDGVAEILCHDHHLFTKFLFILEHLQITNELTESEKAEKRKMLNDLYIKNQLVYGKNHADQTGFRVVLIRQDSITSEIKFTYTLYLNELNNDNLYQLYHCLSLLYFNHIKIEGVGGAKLLKTTGEEIKKIYLETIFKNDIEKIEKESIDDGLFDIQFQFKKNNKFLKTC